jgi:hypothetical protein
MKKVLVGLAAAIVVASAAPAYSQVRITEVAAWGSSTANPAIPYATDWFELTNFGAAAVNIAGWKMDDNSNLFANAVALTGITSIGAGESVIFTENAVTATFLSTWFGANAPAGLQIGNYTGAGVGLGQGGDAVNVYSSTGALQANVIFGASDATNPFQTFDNASGLNGVTISLLSVVGSNGAFVAANDAAEIGSPGFIATSVPEPETYALMLAGLCFMGCVARRRANIA